MISNTDKVFADQRADNNWEDGLDKRSSKSTSIGSEKNVLHSLRTFWPLKGLVRFNEFGGIVEFSSSPPWREVNPGDPWTDDDDTELAAYLQGRRITVRGTTVVSNCVAVVAKDNRIHPVRDYLSSIVWDGVSRLSDWLSYYMGAQGNPEYLALIGRSWLISGVARVFEPGCQVDHMLVLEAGQGTGKSSAARILAVRPEWFADQIGDIRNKDAALQLLNKWLIEMSELAAVRRADVESVKAFVSRCQDVYRPPYGRKAVTVPRQSIFIGTTNELEYLRDRTGNRRYWPVRCDAIDLVALGRDRDQLWAEANQLYQSGEAWHPSQQGVRLATIEQESRVIVTQLEERVCQFLESLIDLGISEVSSTQIFQEALNLDTTSDKYSEQTGRLAAQLSVAINYAGWRRIKTVGRGKSKRTMYAKAG